MKKAIIFVDANNWYHNVKKFFEPSEIDIVKIGEFIAKARNFDIAEIKWYASVPSIADGERMYYKHISFLQHLQKKGITVITRKLQRLSNEEIQRKRKSIIDNLDLCINCRPLVESVFLDIGDIKRKEKGIDVWAAIDMIKESVIDKRCEVCILISGDADFVPALELIKNHSKEVLTAMVPWGYSYELRQKFPYLILNQYILKKCFRSCKDE